jgi:hypothetical protein
VSRIHRGGAENAENTISADVGPCNPPLSSILVFSLPLSVLRVSAVNQKVNLSPPAV